MRSRGIDTPEGCTGCAGCLRTEGYRFVCRYYNVIHPAKNLTHAEALALSEDGIEIVAVWENGFPTEPGYFSREKGRYDGTQAFRYAHDVVTQPVTAPIYFAVDFDASESNIRNEITAYMEGIREAFHQQSDGQPHFPLGVYGSGLTCSRLLAEGLVEYTWLAQSMGWAGSSHFETWNIKQSSGKRVCGLASDLDEANGNGGGFMISLPAAKREDSSTGPSWTAGNLSDCPWGMAPPQFHAWIQSCADAGIRSNRVVQTIGSARASSGTHAQDGIWTDPATRRHYPYSAAFDISVFHLHDGAPDPLSDTQIHALLNACASNGIFGWWRRLDSFASNQHIHLVYAGLPMKQSLREQCHAYLHHRDGLADGRPDDFFMASVEQDNVIRALLLAHNPIA